MATAYVSPEALTACGNACVGLGEAIKGLSQAGLEDEAKELSRQLLQISKSLSWLIREDRSKYQS